MQWQGGSKQVCRRNCAHFPVLLPENLIFFEGYGKYCLQPWDVEDKYVAGKAADLI